MKNLTIVTAYFEIPKKKFSSNVYIKWIINYMNLIKDNYIVIYTNSENIEDIIKNIRINYLSKTKIILTNINDLYCYKYINYFNEDYKRDNEKYHDPLLYLIWNNKTEFMYDAFKKNYFNTELYAWTDIGMIRNNLIYDTLSDKFPKDLDKIENTKVYLLEVENFKENELNYNTTVPFIFNDNRCGGGVILCSKYIIEYWFETYYNMLDLFIKNNIFAGKDQNILNNIYLKFRNNLIYLVKPENSPFDKWFYMLYFMSI